MLRSSRSKMFSERNFSHFRGNYSREELLKFQPAIFPNLGTDISTICDYNSTFSFSAKSGKLELLETRTRKQSSRPKVFCRKGVLRNFGKFAGKHLCQSLFFNKVCNFIKKRGSDTGVFL